MAPALNYPGIYVEEVPSGARTIAGAATAVTAFVGRAPRGPVDSDAESPVLLTSQTDYARVFGGLSNDSPLSFAVFQFFENGGHEALVVRVHNGATAARTPDGGSGWQSQAANPGVWGNSLRLRIDHAAPDAVAAASTADTLFHLRVKDLATQQVEEFPDLSITAGHPRFVTDVLARQSRLLRGCAHDDVRPARNAWPDPPDPQAADLFADATSTALQGDTDGSALGAGLFTGPGLRDARRGLYALEKADLFNLLVLPPFSDDPADPAGAADVDPATWEAAIAYATERRAVVLVDPPWHDRGWAAVSDLTPASVTGVAGRSANAAPTQRCTFRASAPPTRCAGTACRPLRRPAPWPA